MDLGAAIRQCRKARGYTQAKLSGISGISVSHLCLLEQNKRDPSISAVEAVAEGLDIPLSVLIFIATEKDREKDVNPEHLEKLTEDIMELMGNGQ